METYGVTVPAASNKEFLFSPDTTFSGALFLCFSPIHVETDHAKGDRHLFPSYRSIAKIIL